MDDVWTFNTQVSSQWDGLRHVAYQKEGLFYNNVTMDELTAVGANGEKSTVNGIQGRSSPCVCRKVSIDDLFRTRSAVLIVVLTVQSMNGM